ncbi:MAG: hypothetical protein HUU32_05105 [Calditrichaceae bacterium]|nr:hypothetical protein [Calditrichia bacterium]NUQ40752.1 hypothetical protein [Calditrichaceae bacterium]
MKMSNAIACGLLITALLAPGKGGCGEEPRQSSAWDTLIAEIQIIESLNQPDSTKSQLMSELFERRQVSLEDYRRFYDDFYRQPFEEQQKFVERIKTLVPQLLNLKQDMQAAEESAKVPVKRE